MHAVSGDFGPDLLHCCTSGGLKNRFSSGFHRVTGGGWADSWEQLEQPYLAIVAWKCDWWPTQPAAEGDDWLELPPTEICILSAGRTVSRINVDAAHFFFFETIELFLTFLSTWMSVWLWTGYCTKPVWLHFGGFWFGILVAVAVARAGQPPFFLLQIACAVYLPQRSLLDNICYN